MTPPLVAARGLSVSVRLATGESLRLLDDVSLDVAGGEALAIAGRSGSGKTTLLSVLGLLATADSGRVELDGRDVTALPDRARAGVRNRSLGFVFQSYSLVPHLTAAENVAMPLLYGERPGRRAARAAVDRALELVGLAGRARSRPQQLSGGEQQRVAIARALVRSPRVVLADEPTGALDVATAEHVLDALFDAVRTAGAALVLVTHDPQVAARADRTLHLDRGALRAPVAGGTR